MYFSRLFEGFENKMNWQCEYCTFTNCKDSKKCEACFNVPYFESFWVCHSCQGHNFSYMKLCAVCRSANNNIMLPNDEGEAVAEKDTAMVHLFADYDCEVQLGDALDTTMVLSFQGADGDNADADADSGGGGFNKVDIITTKAGNVKRKRTPKEEMKKQHSQMLKTALNKEVEQANSIMKTQQQVFSFQLKQLHRLTTAAHIRHRQLSNTL